MAKISLTDIEKVDTSKSALNQNFAAIEQEFQVKVLYRDNPEGEPNTMATDLDMDSNDILNVGNIDVQSLTANGKTLDEYLAEVSAEGLATKEELELLQVELEADIATKQNTLISGTTIKTINSTSILGSGNISISSTTNWGQISGTITDQTDLISALNARQPLNQQLTNVAGLTPADGSFIVGNGTNFVTESGLTARTSLGLGTAATANTGEFATTAQGVKADTAIQPLDIANVLRDDDIGTTVQAYNADTAKTNVTQGYTASQYSVPLALTYAETVTPNLTLRDNFTLTLTGNLTLGNPSAKNVGQSGAIVITQDATGSRLISYGSQWVAEGGAQALSTTANAVDVLYYFVVSSTKIDYHLRRVV